jgi:choline dehydrogenase-like flavoprotein
MTEESVQLPKVAEVVVLGAGTAGCVLAGRLAEAGHEVVVLESGPDYGPLDDGRWPEELLDARTLPLSHDWGYFGRGVGGQELAFQRARVVGGCSSHNGCAQMVGWGPDYDRWAADAPGWGADELRPLFETARERMRMREWDPDEIQPFQRAFVEAAGRMGLPVRNDVDDLDAGAATGSAPVNIVEGIRWNASFAYLDPVRDSGRLTVVGDTVVDRVVIRSGRAAGVEFRRADGASAISAEHVVVCAGAYGTPEVLLRSGVGPAGELRELGIDVALDLPGVGANLHDQPVAQTEFEGSQALADDLSAFAREHWLPEEQATAKLASSISDGPYDLHVFPWVEPDEALDNGWKVVLPVGLLTPRSRGRLTLRSPDPFVNGTVDHGSLREGNDLRALVDGYSWLAELIASAEPLRRYFGKPLSIPEGDDDDAIRAWIRGSHQHYWHPGGSCLMGPATDPGAVVGAEAGVHGLSGLWVADASVFPRMPRATPAWPVVAVGEHVARTMIRHLGG